MESNWSPKWTPRGGPPVQCELTAPDFAQALSSYINPTFPTIGTEAIDSFRQLLVGLTIGRGDFLTLKPDNPRGRDRFCGRRVTGVTLKRHRMGPAVTECEQSPITP